MSAEIQLYDTQGKRLYLNAEERAAFVAAALQERREVRTLCQTLYYTGVRISEALELVPSRVDLKDRAVIIRSKKKRRQADGTPRIVHRAIPVPEDYLDILDLVHGIKAAQRAKTDDLLWPWTRQHAWRLVKAVMQAAGIDTRQPHASAKGLRHGFGIHALSKDVPLPVVQRMMGHADLKTTAIYLNAVGIEQRDFAARMWC